MSAKIENRSKDVGVLVRWYEKRTSKSGGVEYRACSNIGCIPKSSRKTFDLPEQKNTKSKKSGGVTTTTPQLVLIMTHHDSKQDPYKRFAGFATSTDRSAFVEKEIHSSTPSFVVCPTYTTNKSGGVGESKEAIAMAGQPYVDTQAPLLRAKTTSDDDRLYLVENAPSDWRHSSVLREDWEINALFLPFGLDGKPLYDTKLFESPTTFWDSIDARVSSYKNLPTSQRLAMGIKVNDFYFSLYHYEYFLLLAYATAQSPETKIRLIELFADYNGSQGTAGRFMTLARELWNMRHTLTADQRKRLAAAIVKRLTSSLKHWRTYGMYYNLRTPVDTWLEDATKET